MLVPACDGILKRHEWVYFRQKPNTGMKKCAKNHGFHRRSKGMKKIGLNISPSFAYLFTGFIPVSNGPQTTYQFYFSAPLSKSI
jgi:hypothetical protein